MSGANIANVTRNIRTTTGITGHFRMKFQPAANAPAPGNPDFSESV
jgi:hypothetical protein